MLGDFSARAECNLQYGAVGGWKTRNSMLPPFMAAKQIVGCSVEWVVLYFAALATFNFSTVTCAPNPNELTYWFPLSERLD